MRAREYSLCVAVLRRDVEERRWSAASQLPFSSPVLHAVASQTPSSIPWATGDEECVISYVTRKRPLHRSGFPRQLSARPARKCVTTASLQSMNSLLVLSGIQSDGGGGGAAGAFLPLGAIDGCCRAAAAARRSPFAQGASPAGGGWRDSVRSASRKEEVTRGGWEHRLTLSRIENGSQLRPGRKEV